jgi:hypothetical protein
MQLDKTRIAVRERGAVDTMDLALHVFRANFGPLFAAALLGAVPFAILNHLLIRWMLQFDEDAALSAEVLAQIPRFVWTMIVLVVIEAPLASAFTTTCLGQVVFLEKPDLRNILKNVRDVFGRLVWSQLILRGLLPALLLTLAIDRGETFSGADTLLALLFLLVLLRRSLRPYLSEIVLLEHLPYQETAAAAMTISRRNYLLHGPNAGDLFYRWLVTSFFATLLVAGWLGAFISLQGIFLGQWIPGRATLTIGLPLSLWLVVAYVTVVRFLNYLDLRIRLEGWEVELRIRAEAARLVGAWQ